MLKNYIKIAWRNIWKNKAFSVINIGGLAVGMASAILILIWIENELSYDRFHENGKNIYKLYNRDTFDGENWAWGNTPKILGKTIKEDYPEVSHVARVDPNEDLWLKVGNKKFKTTGIITDVDFLQMFSFPLYDSDESSILKDPSGIVITQKLAKKLFDDNDAMGQTIQVEQSHVYKVAGILKDLPNNTRFNFDFILPWNYMKVNGWDDSYWGNNSVQTFVQLKPHVSQVDFDKHIKEITINHTKESAHPSSTEVFSWPLEKLWLYSKSENGKLVAGKIITVRLFSVIAIFILLIACINFMNLSTARSEKRAKEVGIRKVVGAQKRNLILQFTGESILITFFAGILALLLVFSFLNPFNQLVNKSLHIDYTNFTFWLLIIGFILFTGLLAGCYPAFYLSSFQPAKVLKGKISSIKDIIMPRKILVVSQFTFAILLITCTIIINRQINYAQQRDTGYVKENLIYTILDDNIRSNYLSIKNELLQSNAVVAVTKTLSPITEQYSDSWGFSWNGSTEADHDTGFTIMSADTDFTKSTGTKIIAGRDIDINTYPSDSTAILLNETAVEKMRLKNPIGAIVSDSNTNWKVVGVIQDFIIQSPYEPIQPMMICGPSRWFGVMHMKLNSKNSISENLATAEKIFKKFNQDYPFEYHFVDEKYANKFESEKRTASLSALFAGLTIFISCLGLFGLATYMVHSRIQEIGIRKVLGANIAQLVTLLSSNFLQLVLISFFIASPIAWYAMSRWLNNYTYNIGVEWWVFALVGIVIIFITLLTVSSQAIKAALSNPVKNIKTE
ncbi:ABC transporter permease [Zunongwangia pacifica]|uniref:ABC transporter permease n=1 Tax=Zunongwangia pacifica TaxID=2911062 RepID=A0A9X1ZLU0_9FLAO|nr:ABC transporter permease [Zunongwangia pacifica]MCL6216982.1 ABC transporter permease [Zunongwangia pacifica]